MAAVVGSSTAWRDALECAERVARTPAPVLITGETGTGKELVARHYHACASRPGPMVPVNCGAIPAEIVEYALFGYARGAYTGAVADSPGYVRSADRGTLFLDEIGELPLLAQVKLLRVLQERTVQAVGTVGEKPVDFRLVAATHRDLHAMTRATPPAFREDLWYRLSVCVIDLPPLRERGGDVIELARHFVERDRATYGTATRLAPGVETALLEYGWPGNVRELEATIRRGLINARGAQVTLEDLAIGGPKRRSAAQDFAAAMVVKPTTEHGVDFDALEQQHGGARAACKALGWKWTTYRDRKRAAARPGAHPGAHPQPA